MKLVCQDVISFSLGATFGICTVLVVSINTKLVNIRTLPDMSDQVTASVKRVQTKLSEAAPKLNQTLIDIDRPTT